MISAKNGIISAISSSFFLVPSCHGLGTNSRSAFDKYHSIVIEARYDTTPEYTRITIVPE